MYKYGMQDSGEQVGVSKCTIFILNVHTFRKVKGQRLSSFAFGR